MRADGSVRPRVSGPLARFEAAFRAELARAGYTPSSARGAVAAMAQLSRWLEVRAVSPAELRPPVVADVRVRQLAPVLGFLREIGEVPAPDSTIETAPVEALLARFRAWLAEERGLSPVTVGCYGEQARTFLLHLPEPLDAPLRGLDAGQVTSFMLGYSSACCSMRSPMRCMTLPRSDAVIRRQSEPSSSKHRRAARTARSMSSASPWATHPRFSPVAGLSVSG
jgi:hypothetical protein